jgi:hypothetical protein
MKTCLMTKEIHVKIEMKKINPHDYVCGIIRNGQHLDLRVDQLTLEEVQQVLCQTFDMVDVLEEGLEALTHRINHWRTRND